MLSASRHISPTAAKTEARHIAIGPAKARIPMFEEQTWPAARWHCPVFKHAAPALKGAAHFPCKHESSVPHSWFSAPQGSPASPFRTHFPLSPQCNPDVQPESSTQLSARPRFGLQVPQLLLSSEQNPVKHCRSEAQPFPSRRNPSGWHASGSRRSIRSAQVWSLVSCAHRTRVNAVIETSAAAASAIHSADTRARQLSDLPKTMRRKKSEHSCKRVHWRSALISHACLTFTNPGGPLASSALPASVGAKVDSAESSGEFGRPRTNPPSTPAPSSSTAASVSVVWSELSDVFSAQLAMSGKTITIAASALNDKAMLLARWGRRTVKGAS